MIRTLIAIVSLAMSISLAGCSGPSNSDAKRIARSAMSGMSPGISENEISILKTFANEGHNVVVAQAGNLICEISAIKGNNGWITRGYNCSGSFISAWQQKDNILSAMKKEIQVLNKKVPFMEIKGIRNDKYDLLNDLVIYYQTFTNVSASDVKPADIEAEKKAILSHMCADAKDRIEIGIQYSFKIRDKDGKPLIEHIINKDTCSKKL